MCNLTRFSATPLLLLCLTIFSPTVAAAGSSVEQESTFMLLLPVIIAGIVTPLIWKLLLPNSLSSLQVAFEVDDGLYEVHRLTKNRSDAKQLLKLPRVGRGVSAYLMAMAGILILIAELIILPGTFHKLSVILMFIMIVIPIIYSPLETLAAQLPGGSDFQQKGGNWLIRFIKRFSQLILLLVISVGLLFYGWNVYPEERAYWIVYASLLFMSPTILAYGRILGASWNMLLINKWRSYHGEQTPVNPEKPGFMARSSSLILVVFLATMPVAAVNGILTVMYVLLGDAPQTTQDNILNYGGLLGWGIIEAVNMQELIEQFQWLKGVPVILAAFLSLNIAIVGLAFIFELIRNLFIGGQTFSGFGGVVLATPHEIRAEKEAQSRLLYFSFAGFSGYTVLLLVLVCYKEFSSLMPYASSLEANGFTEPVIILATWSFIAVGQAVFLIIWLLSLPRLKILREMKFDLSPEERREELVEGKTVKWMSDMVNEAAVKEDVNGLRLFQQAKLGGDEAVIRMEKTRARMIERAIRGLWPQATVEARSLLAQQGGSGIEARLILASSYLATRRLDAAKQVLYSIPKEEVDDEVELLMILTEFLDPWRGNVGKKQRLKHTGHPSMKHLQMMMECLAEWEAWDEGVEIGEEMMELRSRLSSIAMLRMQRRGMEALELAVSVVKDNPTHVLTRISLALCLLDGMAMPEDRFSALEIYSGLVRDAAADPRVHALGAIIGDEVSTEEIEPALTQTEMESQRSWIDEAPVNPIAAMFSTDGADEVLSGNVLVMGHQAIDRGLQPSLRNTGKENLFHYFILMPLWLVLGFSIFFFESSTTGFLATLVLVLGHVFLLRVHNSQQKNISHRNQSAMISMAKRMQRNKVDFDPTQLPVGTHLLLCGLLVSVRGVNYDIGMPGWLVERVPASRQKDFLGRIEHRRKILRTTKPARNKTLTEAWWKSTERKASSKGTLARLLGEDVSLMVCGPDMQPTKERRSVRRKGSRRSGAKGDSDNSGKRRKVVRRKKK